MCDMQKMPREDASCEEDAEMNFATLSAVGGAGTHFVTTGGQLPMAKLQQNVTNTGMQQVVSMMGSDGVQYVRTLDGTTLQAAPQLISVPIALPGAKPGDPQPTVQIQVLNPNILQQQQPKYQMQIPIQGLQQGAVLTVAYSPDANDGSGIQLLGNALPDGLQVLTMPHEMQLIQPAQAQMQDNKEHIQQQIFITQNQQQLVINSGDDKTLNNNNTINNNNSDTTNIIIKQECDDKGQEDESSQGTETCDGWQISASSQQDLVKYLNQLPPQQTQALPASLQQFLRLNPTEMPNKTIEIEVLPIDKKEDMEVQEGEAIEDEQSQPKKRKKSKKKATKPARPKPGQVVIATAADGSVVYCCPECDNAYPEKEQLEMHLIVHKIERRFICGICGAGLKRKEHLERHKLGHNPERPYVCNVCWKGFKRREHLNLHTVIHSGVKTEMCGQCGKGFYRKDHLRKHTRSHETRRARDEAAAERAPQLMPEITIQVPTSENMQVPVQISIPQHVVTSLAAARAHEQLH